MPIVLGIAVLVGCCAAEPAAAPVAVSIETTLKPSGDHIRQFAFDGDANTYFASAQNAGLEDHFTLVFDKPVALKSIGVSTGRPDGADRLETGALESSTDGKSFSSLAKFADGSARADGRGDKIRAV